MDEQELLTLITGGESQQVEFKQALSPSVDETAEDLCALANGDSPGTFPLLALSEAAGLMTSRTPGDGALSPPPGG